jgi:cardiolipin synthase
MQALRQCHLRVCADAFAASSSWNSRRIVTLQARRLLSKPCGAHADAMNPPVPGYEGDPMAAQFEAIPQPALDVAAAQTSSSGFSEAARWPQLRALARSLDLPVLGGNRLEVFARAAAARAVVFDAIDHAADHVNIERWQWLAGSDGERLAQRLLARAREGVHVNLMLESTWPRGAAPGQLERLRRGGVRVCEFQGSHPLGRWLHGVMRPQRHRALMVVDGRIAFIGLGGPARPDAFEDGDRVRVLRVEGPAVGELQWLFVDCWRHSTPSPMHSGRYFPALGWVGTHRIGIAPAGCRGERTAHARAVLAAVDAARDRALLLGTHGLRRNALRRALVAACQRGVDVHLLVPDDWARGLRAPRSSCASLLRAGVHVHALRHGAQSAHASVIDGVWASIDAVDAAEQRARSPERDRLIVLDAEFGAQAEVSFWSDVARSSDAIADPASRPSSLRRLNLRLAHYLEVTP